MKSLRDIIDLSGIEGRIPTQTEYDEEAVYDRVLYKHVKLMPLFERTAERLYGKSVRERLAIYRVLKRNSQTFQRLLTQERLLR